ncbi:unnamed protein product [Rhizophagus irregularis]|uniref:Homeobox domain-containing protein n=1 Tax=Rhizophagus irregularis TaxID=588596 RepID=A0A915ZH22_9GLOM|nr:unnamed protein product [Rhizophagus irregularis]CAB5375989.1 unnamed protein product [Rhizophagus irregularis]
MDDQRVAQVSQQRQPRPRFHFTEEHLGLLEGIYQQAKYPDKSQKVKAAGAIGATESQVNEWFQRRRKKEMKLQREQGATNLPTTTVTTTTPTTTTTAPFINVAAESNIEHSTETTSPYFSPFDGGPVMSSIPDHEVYVYISDPPQQTQENMYNTSANLLPGSIPTELQYYNNFISPEYMSNGNNNIVNSNNFASSNTNSTMTSNNFSSNSTSINNNMSNNFANNNTSINHFPSTINYDNNIIASVKLDEPRKTNSNQNSENNESRELIASIMTYLNHDLGLISTDVVKDFLKKVKDTSPNTLTY